MSWMSIVGALISGAFVLSTAGVAAALDGETILVERCASCNALTGPAPRTFKGVLDPIGRGD